MKTTKIKYVLIGIAVCLTFSFTLYNGTEVPGNKILNTVQVPLQQKLVKVIDNETQANKMVKSGFVLQDVDIYDGKKFYTLVLY
jgi:hypothetical protein